MKKIKILYILPKLQQGGAERQLFYLIKNLDKRKFKIYLGLLYTSNEMKKDYDSLKNISTVQFGKKNALDVNVYFKISSFIDKHQIDIIHSFMGGHHSYLASSISRRKPLPVGGIMSSFDDKLPLVERINRFNISKYFCKNHQFKLVSCSHSGTEIYKKRGFTQSEVFTIPNGIDFRQYRNGNGDKIRKEFNLQSKMVFSNIGRLVDVKNQAMLITLFEELIKKVPKAHLLIIGGGPDREILQKKIEKLKLEKCITLTGPRKDIPDLLAATDIFLFPSLSEGWPNVVGEAMASGVPVVSYPVGDVRHIITSSYNGIITENNPESFKKEVLALAKSKKRRMQMGLAGQKKIQSSFSVEKMVGDYERFYLNQIVGGRTT